MWREGSCCLCVSSSRPLSKADRAQSLLGLPLPLRRPAVPAVPAAPLRGAPRLRRARRVPELRHDAEPVEPAEEPPHAVRVARRRRRRRRGQGGRRDAAAGDPAAAAADAVHVVVAAAVAGPTEVSALPGARALRGRRRRRPAVGVRLGVDAQPRPDVRPAVVRRAVLLLLAGQRRLLARSLGVWLGLGCWVCARPRGADVVAGLAPSASMRIRIGGLMAV